MRAEKRRAASVQQCECISAATRLGNDGFDVDCTTYHNVIATRLENHLINFQKDQAVCNCRFENKSQIKKDL